MTRSQRDKEEWRLREDHPQPMMRPSFNKLISKLRDLKSLQDHPEAVQELIHLLAHRFFIYEKTRPEHLFRTIVHLHNLWNMSLGSPLGDQTNERQLNSAPKTVTGDELLKSGSLSPAALGAAVNRWVDDQLVDKGRLHRSAYAGREEDTTQRNDTTPGPSHKSPIGYVNKLERGFTIPGFAGKWLWQGPKDQLPDMDEVVAVLARPFVSSDALDLEAKPLKKRVRQVIFNHAWESGPQGGIFCSKDGKEFDFLEEWAIHVRKLIWKELKKG